MNTTTYEREREDILTKEETANLISADKVEGTAVYDRSGDKLGTVNNVMITKHDGRVRYVVMSSGGLFGMGADFTPLPWDALDYDTDKGGYCLKTISKAELENSQPPRFSANEEHQWDQDYERRVRLYYFPIA